MTITRTTKTLPCLRFPEFTGDWQARKLGDFIIEKKHNAPENIPLYSLTIEKGVTEKTERYERGFLVKSEDEAYKLVENNDFAYNPMNLRFGALARYTGIKPVKVSKYYDIFCLDKSVDAFFIECFLKNYNSMKYYNRMAMGSLFEKTRLHFSDFLKFIFPIPSIAEQEKIASFLGAIDTRLTQLRRKHKLLQTYKRGVMQKIFSQEVRFKGAIGLHFPDWEKKDFGDIVTKVSSKYDPTTSDTSYPCIELESIISNEGKLVKMFDSKEQQSIKNKFKSGDVLFGKLRPYLRKFISANFEGVCSTEIWIFRGKKVSAKYLYYLVQTDKFYKIANVTFGSKMPRSDWDFVSSFPFECPCKEEQEKIADFLTAIDQKIEAVARQIDRTEHFKKGLLQKMFV